MSSSESGDQGAVHLDPRNAMSWIANWGIANAMKQKQDLETAHINKMYDLKGGPPAASIPFGGQQISSPTYNLNTSSLLGKLGQVVALGAAVYGGGAALGALGLLPVAAKAVTEIVKPAEPQKQEQGPITIPVEIDWRFDPNGGTIGRGDPAN